MPQFGKKQIKKLSSQMQRGWISFLDMRARAIQKGKHALKETAYWTSVLTIGLLLTGVIAQVGFGVEIFAPAYADTSLAQGLAILLGNLFYIFFTALILMAAIFAYILEVVLLYPYGDPSIFTAWEGNGFVNVDQVVIGWKLVRDVCNIFFAIILVIIALASVLKIEAYSWKQLLPKFFIAAILINFSKSIAGFFTDLGTVVMATFGSSFTGTFARALIGGFGLPTLMDVGPSLIDKGQNNTDQLEGSGFFSILLAYIAACVMAGVFFVLMVVFAATLLFRIIMLWFLIVLSPLAYITRILPVTQKYSSQWWEMFGRYVLVGPLVTFFLWLSLTMAFGGGGQQSNEGSGFNNSNPITQGISQAASQTAKQSGITQPPVVGQFQSTNPNILANFVLATLMLLASLKLINQMAQEFGSVTGVLQSKAEALALRSSEKIGQIGMVYGSTAGTQPGLDENGNPRQGSASYYLGRTAAVLSGTLGQPITFLKQAAENLSKSSEGKQQAARNHILRSVAELRKQEVMGRKDTFGRTTGFLANVAGVVAGAGMADGQVVFDNYFSGLGLKRGLQKAYATTSFFGHDSLMDKATQEDKKLEDAKKKVTEEEAKLSEKDAAAEAERYTQTLSKLPVFQKIAKALGTPDDPKEEVTEKMLREALFDKNGNIARGLNAHRLDTKDDITSSFLETHIQSIIGEADYLDKIGDKEKASALRVQAQGLNKLLENKGSIGIAAFLEKFGGRSSLENGFTNKEEREKAQLALFSDVRVTFDDMSKDLAQEQENIKKGLVGTGYTFDEKTGEIKEKGTSYRNDAKLEEYKTERNRAEAAAKMFRTKLASLDGDDGYLTHVAEQKERSEALSALSNVFQSNQLIERFYQAQGSNDVSGMWAVLQRLNQLGNLNDFFQGYHSVDGEGNVNNDAGSGAQALRKVIDAEFGGLTNERMRKEIMSDLTVNSFLQGEYDRALAVSYVGGDFHYMDEPTRKAVVIAQASKQRPRDLAGKSRFSFIEEDGFGNLKNLDIGAALIARMGTEFANPNVFPNIQPAALYALSQPASIKKLVAEGAPAEFITQLRKWRAATAKAYNTKTRGSRLASA